jgi:hypothetical protein
MEAMTDDKMKPRADLDFGPDPDVVPEPDPAFDAWIVQAAPRLNEPNATPRAEMWREIQSALHVARDAQAGQIPGVTPLRRGPWRLIAVVAAALLLGVALDRMVLPRSVRVAPPTAEHPPASDSGDPTRLYRMAASQTLTQAEALLTAYRADAEAERNALGVAKLGASGREVLSSTRLLIDSPAGEDPQLRALLEDLELVLVQIIRLSSPQPDASDREHVDRALKDSDLLPRIRTAVPAGLPGAASSD